MNDVTSTDWQTWIAVQKTATRVGLLGGDLSAAIALVDQYLEGGAPASLEREAIAFRGTLRQECGDLKGAAVDFLAAWRLAEPGYVRFELEDTLAEVSLQSGDSAEADRWFSAALESGAADCRVVGGGFLLRFLKFRGCRGLSSKEHRLATKMVDQGWHLLRIEGEPILDNLEEAAKRMVQAQRVSFSTEHPPKPKAGVDPVGDS